ncbi:hypothetical protein [Reyranella sp.]|uniref:hypothetical protein n=1 Tax=Reyranella sp. TaxID=1929291 RepID=UPI003D14349F
MSARLDDLHELTVERRIGRVRAILTGMQSIARNADDGFDVGSVCEELELMAQEELGKITAVLGTEVLDRRC